MKLIKCKKCGATICTDAAFQERMLDAIEECHKKARKDRRNYNIYIHEASVYKKILTQYIHTTTDYNSQLRRVRNEHKALVAYLLENNLISTEKLTELEQIGRARAEEKDKADEIIINDLYASANNPLFNTTKADPTAKQAFKTLA